MLLREISQCILSKLTSVLPLLVVVLCVISVHEVHATHNRAGEITYVQIDNFTIRATITTYTKTSSEAADRDSLEIFWGDGTSEFVKRENGNGMALENDVKLNFYIAEHTYPGRGTYTMSMTDPNRIANILNVNFPRSVDIPFYIETTFTLLNPVFQGFNSSAILLQPPIDYACRTNTFIHNVNAYDPDGDSLAYELGIPKMSEDEDVPAYLFPNEIQPGDDNQISLDPITGDFVWNAPQRFGEYNIVIKIKEYRDGILINEMIRDMQIFVQECDNRTPEVAAQEEWCVLANETLNIPIIASDQDLNQALDITATGGPFESENNKATLVSKPGPNNTINAEIEWTPSCNDISEQPFQIVIRAADEEGLASLKTIRVFVSGPPPENLTAVGTGQAIELTWDAPYDCEITENEYFRGFSIWRKRGPQDVPIDTCKGGLDGQGYEEIVFITKEKTSDNQSYIFTDEDVQPGVNYCYRILGEFAQLTPSGNPFNPVSSLPSNESCALVKRDLPILTKASVVETDPTDGVTLIEWVKPYADDLDTIMNPGPYEYVVQRRIVGSSEYTDIIESTIVTPNFADEVDLSFQDLGLNTENNQYDYRIKFSANNALYGHSDHASTPFSSINTSDRQLNITVDANTPWFNSQYVVYRQEVSGDFIILDTIENPMFQDDNLVNGTEYCYYFETIGTLSLADTPDPIINFSQIVCGIPTDNLAPCAPDLSIQNICDIGSGIRDENAVLLNWNIDNCSEREKEGIQQYNIYSSSDSSGFRLLDQVSGDIMNFATSLEAMELQTCYQIEAVDDRGNVSDRSNIVCNEVCSEYILPNTFTPNGDGSNDLFIPITNIFVNSVDFVVYTRLGVQVFTTNDPELNWDGNDNNGNELEGGVYYYTCKANAEFDTDSQLDLAGYIQIIR